MDIGNTFVVESNEAAVIKDDDEDVVKPFVTDTEDIKEIDDDEDE